ncbi:uncharacterized protein LOC134213369 isoform X2 [Armigeres subalbatus]|uniref:uncharacterized protein LOC134213369 isoform X2 n=1 Tax=Armigeres subalbatus TaxID=124917 RepID=UPI002ED5A210
MNRIMNHFIAAFLIGCILNDAAFAKGVKRKRLLYDLSDPVITVTESSQYYHPPAIQSSIYSEHTPVLDQIIKPLPPPLPSYLPKPSLSSIFKNNYFEYSNYGSPFQFISGNQLGFHDESTYIADGRILKQYAVTEHHPEEVERNQLLQSNEYRSAPSYFDGGFPPALDQFDFPYPSSVIGFNPRFGVPLNSHHQSPLLTRNHGPVALGSGSIGYIHGPNGVAIGSGSLGYISHKQHRDSLQELIERKSRKHRPSPLHFGHNHD